MPPVMQSSPGLSLHFYNSPRRTKLRTGYWTFSFTHYLVWQLIDSGARKSTDQNNQAIETLNYGKEKQQTIQDGITGTGELRIYSKQNNMLNELQEAMKQKNSYKRSNKNVRSKKNSGIKITEAEINSRMDTVENETVRGVQIEEIFQSVAGKNKGQKN